MVAFDWQGMTHSALTTKNQYTMEQYY